MFKRRLLAGLSALSLAAFGLTSLSYAHEAQPNDDRGRHHIQANDDRGAAHHTEVQVNDDRGAARHTEVQVNDDRGADRHIAVQAVDDRGVDLLPDARRHDDAVDDDEEDFTNRR